MKYLILIFFLSISTLYSQIKKEWLNYLRDDVYTTYGNEVEIDLNGTVVIIKTEPKISVIDLSKAKKL